MENILAQLVPFSTKFDPKDLLPLIILVAVVIGLYYYNKLSQNGDQTGRKKTAQPKRASTGTTVTQRPASNQNQRPEKKELKQIGIYFSFTNEQSDFFAVLCTRYRIAHPARLFQDHTLLDAMFTKAFQELQAVIPPTRESEHDKTMLFTIRETIDNRKRSGKPITSTRLLQSSQEFTVITHTDEHYPSHVIENLPGGLLCAVPRDSFDNELRLPLWSKIRVLFFTASGQSYQLTSRILKYDSGTNVTRMMISHSDSLQAMPHRRHDRKPFKTECTLSAVRVANVVNGKRTEHKFYPSPKTAEGIILDISVGGCSIQTGSPQNVGEYLQIECILQNEIKETIIGKVMRLKPAENDNEPTMHIQFAKMPRATLNRIFSYVYNYGENTK